MSVKKVVKVLTREGFGLLTGLSFADRDGDVLVGVRMLTGVHTGHVRYYFEKECK